MHCPGVSSNYHCGRLFSEKEPFLVSLGGERRDNKSICGKETIFEASLGLFWASQVALMVKNPPADAGDKRNACLIPGSQIT